MTSVNGTSHADRLPPQNLAAEAGVLGAILQDEAAIDDVLAAVGPDDFWRDAHQVIYRAVAAMRAEGRTIDFLTVADELQRRGDFDRAGGLDALAGLANAVPATANARHYAEIVRQKATARRLIEAARDLIERAYSEQYSADDLTAHAERTILGIAEGRNAGDLTAMGDAVAGEVDRILRRRGGEVIGISTGFPDLDEMTDGFQPTQLIILAARPGRGKSSLALNFAERCALAYGEPVLFVSQEMGHEELAGRLIASRLRIDHNAIRNGQVGASQLDAARALADRLRAAGTWWVDDTPGRTVAEIAAIARRLKARRGLGLVIVDYMQLLESGGHGRESRQEQVAAISRDLKRLAMGLRVPVVALSQLNRQVEARDDQRPRMSDLRESGAIENDANIVLLLHQPEGDRSNLVDCIVDKNRNGPTGVVPLVFLRHLMRFESAAPVPDPIPAEDF